MRALALLLCLWSSVAMAQPVQQSGYITPGHVPVWIANGAIGDGGSAAAGKLTSLGVTASGPALCQNSGITSGPYNQICLSVTQNGGGQVSLFNYGGATGSLSLNYGGSVVGFNYSEFTGTQCLQEVNGTIQPSGATCANGSFAVPNSQIFSSPGSVTTLTLTNTPLPISGAYLSVMFDGVTQARNTWSLNATSGVITFSAAIPSNVQIVEADWLENPSAIAGVGSLNGLGGSITLVGEQGVNVSVSGQNININATGSVNAQSSSYTIAATDCGNTVVETGAFQTITLPSSLTGFPSSCPVRIVNGSSSRAQALANFPSSLPPGCGGACLWPNQGVTVGIASSAWIVIVAPGRWKAPFSGGVQLYASPSGSDDNDCLNSAAPCATIGNSLNIVQDDIDFSGLNNIATINLASGTYDECIGWYGPIVGAEDVTILGNVSFPGSYTISCTNNFPVQTRDHSTITLEGVTVIANTNGFSAVFASQFSSVDLNGVQLEGSSNANDIVAAELGTVNIVGPVTVPTTINNFALISQGASLNINGNITINSAATVTTFITATETGTVIQNSSNTITNNGTVTNTCSISLGGGLNRAGVTYPGTVGSCPTSPGWLN